ncbi:pyruvate, phosphate dikinase [Nocardioides sp. NPDC057577]|uniref:pyruvate, phosphate dikinase n=1 Tax=Nocardioides sp. NPDC057577 TaxID=3346171 RepID=UPI0036714157
MVTSMIDKMAAGIASEVVRLDGTCELERAAIGGKAWSVNAMRAQGLPVPPAVALTTGCCADFYAAGGAVPEEVWQQVRQGIAFLEEETGRGFGDDRHPLLVSVRSGAPVSMPGMMDTVLNLGLTAAAGARLAAESGDEAYVSDTRERFVRQYRETVLADEQGEVPDDPWDQLRAAVGAVFASWQSPRAVTYRASRGIAGDLGTAVTIQAMVFGNLDDHSGTGVLFTRNPSTGAREPFGEWLPRGQGEDVVSGRVTPQPLAALAVALPGAHARLMDAARALEVSARDVQDIEFTVEGGRLWLLQTRSAKRSAAAAVRIAVDLVDEGLLTEEEAVGRVTPEHVRGVLATGTGAGLGDPLVTGEAACPGLATGVAVTDPDEAEVRAEIGEDVILVRSTTSPDDLHGMLAARGIVTEYGGATSHAAVVSREIARPCVVGCGAGALALLAGREITVDGATGQVWEGRVEAAAADPTADPFLRRLAGWAERQLPGAARAQVVAMPPAERILAAFESLER